MDGLDYLFIFVWRCNSLISSHRVLCQLINTHKYMQIQRCEGWINGLLFLPARPCFFCFFCDNPPADIIYIWYRPGSAQGARVRWTGPSSGLRVLGETPRTLPVLLRLPPLRSAAAPIHQLPLPFIWQISLTWRFVNCVTACARWKPSVRLTNEAGYWRYTGPGVGFIYTVTGHNPAYWCEGLG